MAKLDMVIKNGEIVTTTGSSGQADIGILKGKIVQIWGVMDGHSELDATEKLVLPGSVDPHVRLSVPHQDEAKEYRFIDDFTSGSAAALLGVSLHLAI